MYVPYQTKLEQVKISLSNMAEQFANTVTTLINSCIRYIKSVTIRNVRVFVLVNTCFPYD